MDLSHTLTLDLEVKQVSLDNSPNGSEFYSNSFEGDLDTTPVNLKVAGGTGLLLEEGNFKETPNLNFQSCGVMDLKIG